MLIPTENHLIADNDSGSSLFKSSNSSVCIPSIPADELFFIHPHQDFQATVAAHRRERRNNSAPYPMQACSATTGHHAPLGATGVQDTNAFVFSEEATLHAPEPLPAQSSLDNSFVENLNQLAQMMDFAPGAHGTILDPFTTIAENTYPNFGEPTASHIACMAVAGTFASGNGGAGSIGSRSVTPNAADHNRKMSEGQMGRQETTHSPSETPHSHIKVPQLPQVLFMPSTQPHVRPSAPFPAQNVPHLEESSTHCNIHDYEQYPHTASITSCPTPHELTAQDIARYRRKIEEPVREAEVAEKIKKAHKVEAMNQGYTPVDSSVTVSAHYLICCNFLQLGDQFLRITKSDFTLSRWSNTSYIYTTSFALLVLSLCLWNA